jgi:hypothetical protein
LKYSRDGETEVQDDARNAARRQDDQLSKRVLLGALAICALLPASAAAAPSFTINAVGDTMLGNTPQTPARPYSYLDPIEPLLRRSADIVFMNLEGTLTAGGPSKCSGNSADCYAFKTPKRFSRVYKHAGFTVANSANNHYNDFGATGQHSTDSALRHAGIVQTGKPNQIAYVTTGAGDAKIKVALLGFAPYAWASNLLDLSSARKQIHRAKANADAVVVYIHAGAEGAGKTHVPSGSESAFGENRGNSRRFAHMAVDAGASLVIGSGPHVLRGMQFYKHHLIAFSLGNFAGFHNFGGGGTLSRSGVLSVTLGPDGAFQKGKFSSVTLSPEGRPARGGGALSMVRRLSRNDFGRRAAGLRSNGSIVEP